MRFWFILILFILSRLALAQSYPPEVLELIEKLQREIFTEDNHKSLVDLLNSSSVKDVESFVEAIESTDNPETIRAYLKVMKTYEGTTHKFIEVVRKRVRSNPQSLRSMMNTMNELKGKMNKANLRFPLPVRCSVGIGTYIAMQDVLLSIESGFFQRPLNEEELRGHHLHILQTMGTLFSASLCLMDAIVTGVNFNIYLKELKIDRVVERNRANYNEILKEFARGQITYSHSKNRIQTYLLIETYIGDIVDDLIKQAKLNKEKADQLKTNFRNMISVYFKRQNSDEKYRELLEIRDSSLDFNIRTQKLYEYFQIEFTQFFNSFRKTRDWEAIKEIEALYEHNVNQIKVQKAPSGMVSLCHAGLGAGMGFIGLHTAAGLEETSIDNKLVKFIRNNRESLSYFVPALILPCFLNLRLLPAMYHHRLTRGSVEYFIKPKDLELIKVAAMRAEANFKEKSHNTSIFQIIIDYYYHRIREHQDRSIPSSECLDKLLNLNPNRIPASQSGGMCSRVLRKIFWPYRKRVKRYTSVNNTYEKTVQFVKFNKLAEILIKRDQNLKDPFMKIKELETRYCK